MGLEDEKKRINPLALVVSTLSFFKATAEVSVPVPPPAAAPTVPCHLAQQEVFLEPIKVLNEP